MNKLDELEKALRVYQELLKNAQMGYAGQPGGMTQPSEATMKTERLDDGKEEKKDDKKDEKKDKKAIEAKMDEHNEKKHGEAKDEDSALTKSIEVINFNNNSQWSLDD